MKKIILILSVIVTSYSCKAQDNIINSSELTIGGINFLGNNVSLATQHLGQPNSIEDYFYEMQDVMTKKYKYNGITFTFINNRNYSFEITGNNYAFTKHNIKVGDNISTLQSIYPISFANRANTGIGLSLNDIDQFIIISYSNNLISKIALYSY